MSQADNTGGALFELLERAYRKGFTIQGDFARRNAHNVGAAASLGLITTHVDKNTYGRDWQVTAKGLRWLNEHKETRR